MLTNQIRNSKCLDSVDIELGKTVVFIGPNNCGKTTALQALALWEIGLRKWNEKRSGKETPEKRPGAPKAIGFEQYYQAEQTGWVLYLEGSTDLAILGAFAGMLDHPVGPILERLFVKYVQNQPARARDHFFALREAKLDLAIEQVASAMKTLGMPDPFSPDVKASDEFLDRVFRIYFKKLGLHDLMTKTDYHTLARFVPRELIDVEVVQVLDAIVAVARAARPRSKTTGP